MDEGAPHLGLQSIYNALGYESSLLSDLEQNLDWEDSANGTFTSFNQ